MANGREGYPDFSVQVALGLVPGFRLLRKFGDNDTVAANTRVDIWPGAANQRVLPAAAGTLSVVSTSTDDDGAPAGTGAQTVRFEGLDANYVEIHEDITMNGTTPVVSSLSFLRVNRGYVILAGTGEGNAGDITATIGADVQAFIEATEGQTHQAMYTVPADTSLIVTDYEMSVGRMATASDIHITGEIMLYGHNAWRVVENTYMTSGQNYDTHHPVVVIPAKSETRMTVYSGFATQVSGMYGGYLISNNMISAM